jgi:hypothetical protein
MDETKKKTEEEKANVPLTRRELLVSLGSAVVLSGLRGVPLEAGQEHAVAGPLPPGLYQPSLDHLNHALSSKDYFSPIAAGSPTDYVRPRSGPFVPQAFTPGEVQLVRRLVEILLGEDLAKARGKPTAAMPGANIYDSVAEWIDLVVASAPRVRELAKKLPADQRALAVAYFDSEGPVLELETFDPEKICREGFAWIGEETQRRFGKGFLSAGAEGQTEIVLSISDNRPDKSLNHAGTRLFDLLKPEVIRGFYTSRIGLNELGCKENAFYGSSPGCGIVPGTSQS